VAELRLQTRSPLRGVHPAGFVGITINERPSLSLTLITHRRAMRKACADKLRAAYCLDPPMGAKFVQGAGITLSWAGPESWLMIAAERPDFETELATSLGDTAAVVDLSDARAMLRIGGGNARALLAKGVSIDLHPRAFGPGDTAITLLAHAATQLWQIDQNGTFDIAMPRATAHDVVDFLTISAGS
jgi:sarcosine oxidase subunit gamma